MRSILKYTGMLAFVCMATANYAQSSLTPEMKQKMMQDIIAEKIHTVPEGETREIEGLARTTLSAATDKKLTLSMAGSTEEAEAAIIVNPNDSNSLVCSFMSQSGSGLVFPIYYSNTKGSTWIKSSFDPLAIAMADFPGGQAIGGGDPVFAWDKVNNKLYMAWIYLIYTSSDTSHFVMYWAYSTNKGLSWQVEPGDSHFVGQGAVNPSTGAYYNYKDGACDREWLAVDNSGGPRQGTLYCAFINFEKGGECVRAKSAGATSFGPFMLAYSGSSQLVNIECDNSGGLDMSFADIAYNQLHFLRSATGSAPFVDHTVASGTNLWGKTNIVTSRENSAPSLAVDAKNNMHIAWMDIKAGKTYAYYTRSTDSGAHWSTPKRIDSLSPVFNGDMMFMPTISAAANSVTITVTAIAPHNQGDSARVYQLNSADNGATFNKWPVLVSSQATYYPQYTPANWFFGDYNKSVSTTCMTYAIWEDGRKTQGPKVYMVATNHCTLEVNQVTAIASSLQIENVYPNPASDHVTLDITDAQEEPITVSITDMNGRVVATQAYKTAAGNQKINMPLNLRTGTYVLSVNDKDGLIATRNLQIVK